ncbi:zinc-binding dehydrogenase [Microbispora hainanensis]|uniref:Zinc-binding dehydrogenase n=1 Tax=Microbispora hainanensis TaxID=568844 RepID=A0ABZ1SK50_9ACTN|nr:zinc-binding dehydrogenase [Microbispora hainanensis]
MFAVYASSCSSANPLSGLRSGRVARPEVPEGWTLVRLRAASLNHHDLWSLRGVGISACRLPIILGSDGAGLDERGRGVIVYGVISHPDWEGDETEYPDRTILSEYYSGTFADEIAVPKRNCVLKPGFFTFEEAACLSSTWLTAYRMLFVKSGAKPGDTCLVQGAGGGVSTALVTLGAAAGYRMVVTGRDRKKRELALSLGAERVFELGAHLPTKVDVVMETVGAATWEHSLRSLKPGGTIVVSGATSGADLPVNLHRLISSQFRIVGSTMGTRNELEELLSFCIRVNVKPVIQEVMPLEEARRGFQRMIDGDVFGKIVFTRPGR